MGFSAVLESRKDISDTAYLITFRAETALSWIPGQFFQVWVPVSLHGLVTRKKSYSVASAPRPEGTFDICVKRVVDGLVSNALYALPLGSRVDFEGPSGHFVLGAGKGDVVFLASGTGISPFRAILQDLERRGFSRRVTLVHGVRSESDLLFREEFESLAKRFLKFQYVPALSRPDGSWEGKRGYVQTHVSDVLEETADVEFYVCGLAPMITQCVEACMMLSVPRERIHREVYT